jgi:hypothetical protein
MRRLEWVPVPVPVPMPVPMPGSHGQWAVRCDDPLLRLVL